MFDLHLFDADMTKDEKSRRKVMKSRCHFFSGAKKLKVPDQLEKHWDDFSMIV